MPETRLCGREITGIYGLNIVIRHAHSWKEDKNGGENLCYEGRQQRKSMNTNV
jgi:hypothetical protein